MTLPRVAVINTHPIQHFAPLWREVDARSEITLKVFFCSDWGVSEFRDPDFDKTFKWDVDLLSGYQHEFVPIRTKPKRLGFWETDNPKIGERLSAFSPDVLVLFGYAHRTIWRALGWARRHGVRVMVFSDSELKHPRSLLTRAAKEVVVRGFLSQVDAAMPIGNCNAEYYQHYGLKPDVLFWCPYPVDRQRFVAAAADDAARERLRASYGFSVDDFVISSVGKYIERKRHRDVLDAYLALPSEHRRRAKVMLVGDGPLRADLAARAKAAGGAVVLTGFVNQSQMPTYYAASDLLVVASEVDAHPLVVAEAGFLAVPVMASDRIGCIGPDDSVRHGENGLVYPVGDVPALSAGIMEIMSNPTRLTRFRQRAREISRLQDTVEVAGRFVEAVKKVGQLPPAALQERLARFARGFGISGRA